MTDHQARLAASDDLAEEPEMLAAFAERAFPKLYERFLEMDYEVDRGPHRNEDAFDRFIAQRFPFLAHLERTYYVFGQPDSLRLVSLFDERLLRHLDDLLCRALDQPGAESEARKMFGYALELAVIRLSTDEIRPTGEAKRPSPQARSEKGPPRAGIDRDAFVHSKRGKAMIRFALKALKDHPALQLLSDRDVLRLLQSRGWDADPAEAAIIAEIVRDGE